VDRSVDKKPQLLNVRMARAAGRRNTMGEAVEKGLRVERRFTKPGEDVYETVRWSRRDSRISNPDGSVVFEMKDAEMPEGWSQVAADIMVSKYFRKAGVPQLDERGNPTFDNDGKMVTGPERSARQVVKRLATTWRWWGETSGYFASADDAESFEDELAYMLLHQMAAPNSPQWFNTGLAHMYGITGTPQGFWYVDPDTEELTPSPDSYTRPAPHACFPAGTSITTREGFKPIEKVEPGDLVLTHEGRYRRVTDILQRQVDESLVRLEITRRPARDLVATNNHPILALKSGFTPDRRPEWIAAGDLEPGDHVVVGADGEGDVIPVPMDLASGLGSNFEVASDSIVTRNSPHRPSMKRWLHWDDPDVCRLIGRWLGDGTVLHESRDGTAAGIGFVFDSRDTRGIDDIRELMHRFFGVTAEVELASGQHTATLRYIRRPLGRFFSEQFGEGYAFKTMPGFAFQLPRPHRMQLLIGLFQADGCTHRVGNFRGLNFDESNADLAEGIWRLLRSLGHAPSLLGGSVRPGGTTTHYRVQVSAKDASELAAAGEIAVPNGADLTGVTRRDDLVGYRISHVSHESYYGTVYNLQVDQDESYVANGVIVHNCFINSVDDDLVNDGGIMDLWIREARLFKMGSGTGSNFSKIRAEGEQLSGGGKSSGLMSFLKVGDRAAGAIKSGGTTRRAAKMVILDVDHPDIEAFINWKAEEEKKVRALVAAGYSSDFNGEAYATVSGQNSNNSVRLSNEFIDAVLNDEDWDLTARTDGSVMKTVKARDLWRQIADAAWQCADPGVQFDTTIQEWHTSPAGGRINATNPCAEYVFLDNTACNLASLNLVTFYDEATGGFDLEAYRHAIRLWTIVLEVSVTMAHFPSAPIAQGSYDYRTLGLGYANLGSLLMQMGIAYDSEQGRAIAGAMTAILTGYAYATSAEMAGVVGPFPKFSENAESMLKVIRNHRTAALGKDDFEGVSHKVLTIDQQICPPAMLHEAHNAWNTALKLGEAYGYRNAQTTVLAPTGTIGLLMDCDTTGVEPDFALVKFKKLAGGGYFKIVNQSMTPALRRLGYSETQIEQIVDFVIGTMSLHRAPHINTASLIAKGFTADDVDKIETLLPGVFELGFAFNQWTLGEATMQRLGFTADQYNDPRFNMLKALGYTDEEIIDANDYVCGRQTIEGAPGLLDEHLPVFDCANRNGRYGERFIHHTGHIRMMAAAQPFISGAISKTINMPNEVTIEDIEESYFMSWELGLKAMALYRDGSKASQPLSAKSDDSVSEEEAEELEDALAGEIELVMTGHTTIHAGMFQPGISPSQAYADLPRPRFLLPARRHGYTQEARIGGHKVFLRTGEYDDGSLGELFIDLAKEGATLRGILSCFAIAVSKGLQYGVPLEEFVDTFTFQTFEPRGMVEGHPNIKMANSIVDYVFRALGVEYLHRDELAQVPPVRSDLPEPPKGLALEAGVQLDLTDSAMEDDIDAQVVAAGFVDEDDAADEPLTPTDAKAAAARNQPVVQSVGVREGRYTLDATVRPEAVVATTAVPQADVQTRSVQTALAANMGDAPLCDTCGHITVRNGSCYRCLNCGDSKGCS
jgi:ribonucleoside-diphosphate reductase alpha chain